MKRFAVAFLALFMCAALFAQNDLQVLAVVKLNKNESISLKQIKTRVEMYEKQRGSVLSVDDRKKVLDGIPMGYAGEAEDMAGAALLLCSEEGRYITGIDLLVDGGMSL